jgi:hypothetical protein
MSESKPKTAQDVYEIICGLSAEEREELSAMLEHEDSPGWASPEIEQAWLEESRQRVRLIEEGKAGWVDGEQVLAKLRKLVAE